MKNKILPFLKCGKENQPSGMLCIALLSDTHEEEFMSIQRKEFYALQT